MMDRLQNFVFRGMLSSNGLEVLEDIGILTKDTGSLNGAKGDEAAFALEDFSPMIRFNAIKMSGVYIAFFCFENSVRELIVERMTELVGAGWWNTKVSKKIRDSVKKRKEDDGQKPLACPARISGDLLHGLRRYGRHHRHQLGAVQRALSRSGLGEDTVG
ncbi:hypothetical protein FBR07_04410 [Candidatus Uhrbacteria bacterium UHB]|nr:hypothetical protein [Candidatus Uhrbacteria bacterium UHB]RIL00757.1 MAG: hypothetical protein DCC77_04455 [Candidatus Uhrbacteria bacterium]